MKKPRRAWLGPLGAVVGAMLMHASVAGAQASATISLSCPSSVLVNNTYDVKVSVFVGSGSSCQPPGQSATMCGLGAYTMTLTYDSTKANLVPAAPPDFPIAGGTSTGFASQPPPTAPPAPTPTPDCSLGCQLPGTDSNSFTSGSTPVTAFNSANTFTAPVGVVSIMSAKVKGIALGYSPVGVSSTNLKVYDTVGAPFSVTLPVSACTTAVSQYQCLGDINADTCVTGAEILNCRKALGSCTGDVGYVAQCDGDASGCVDGGEVLRARKNLDACAADGTCLP